MTHDNRLYDIVTALATNNPTGAVGIARNILDERVEGQVREMTQNYSYQGPKNGSDD